MRMSVLRAKYMPELCCEHDWRLLGPGHDYRLNPQHCIKCGAYCQRNESGAIVSYAAWGVEREAAE